MMADKKMYVVRCDSAVRHELEKMVAAGLLIGLASGVVLFGLILMFWALGSR